MKQLMIFGDSIMKGVTFNGQKYQLCQEHNFDFLAKRNIAVQNFSKMGATVTAGLSILKRKLAAQPDASDTTVLFSFGGNDCDYDWAKVSADPDGAFLPNTPQDAYIDAYRDAIRTAQDAGARVAVTSLLPIDAERYMQHISAGNSYDNILHWLGDVGHLYRWQEYYSSLSCMLARAFGCQLVDLRSEFLKGKNFRMLLSSDGIHPTQAGHDIIHNCVSAALI